MSRTVPSVAREPLADPDAIAAHLDVTSKTLAQWRWRKVGPPWLKVGGRVRYRWADVDDWTAKQAGGAS